MRTLLLIAGLAVIGCEARSNSSSSSNAAPSPVPAPVPSSAKPRPTLREARAGFVTKIIRSDGPDVELDKPSGADFALIQYPSPVGSLAAYVTNDPGDGQKHPAIVWIHGGDTNSIGDVWTPRERSNDQSASSFRKAGLVMMFPSLRGGNINPGHREGFFGEVDDILAATDHLAKLPYVDPERIYLGGHSTGGTMVMLVAACSDRYRAVFSLGPAASVIQYGGDYLYCDPNDLDEVTLRSPIAWLYCVKTPLYVFEGERDWGSTQLMANANINPKIQFFKIPGHDHFSIIAPLTERLAAQIVAGKVNVTRETVQGLK